MAPLKAKVYLVWLTNSKYQLKVEVSGVKSDVVVFRFQVILGLNSVTEVRVELKVLE